MLRYPNNVKGINIGKHSGITRLGQHCLRNPGRDTCGIANVITKPMGWGAFVITLETPEEGGRAVCLYMYIAP
jgi:hypothetical protein